MRNVYKLKPYDDGRDAADGRGYGHGHGDGYGSGDGSGDGYGECI